MTDTCECHGVVNCPAMRPPTVHEAVVFLRMPTTKTYRLRCIAHWRELVGASFAEKVEREFRAKRRAEVD